MNRRNYVFESFAEFIRFPQNINEGNGKVTLTEKDIMEFMNSLVDKQMEIVKKQKNTQETFIKNEDNPLDGYNSWLSLKADKNNTTVEKYTETLKTDSSRKLHASLRYATFLWKDVSEDKKKELGIIILAEAISKNYKTLRELLDLVDEKSALTLPPYIGALPEDVDIKDKQEPTIEQSGFLLDEVEELSLFNDNMYEFNDASFKDENIKDKIIEGIRYYLGSEVFGDIKIKKINILSSSNRFRNKVEDDNTTLSWGELAYKRAYTMSKIIGKVAEEQGYTDKKLEELRGKIILNYGGENGDGTSGPNPPEGFKFGYYDNDGFVSGDNRDELVIWELNDKGEPEKEGETIANSKPLSKKDEYDRFKYSNIFIEYEAIQENEDTPPPHVNDIDFNMFGKLPGEPSEPKEHTSKNRYTDRGKNAKTSVKCPSW